MDTSLAKTLVTTYISRSVGRGKKKVRGLNDRLNLVNTVMVVCRVTRHSENQIHCLDFPKQSIMIASFYSIQNAAIAITPCYGIPSPNRLHSPFKKEVPILQLHTLPSSPCFEKEAKLSTIWLFLQKTLCIRHQDCGMS